MHRASEGTPPPFQSIRQGAQKLLDLDVISAAHVNSPPRSDFRVFSVFRGAHPPRFSDPCPSAKSVVKNAALGSPVTNQVGKFRADEIQTSSPVFNHRRRPERRSFAGRSRAADQGSRTPPATRG